MRILVSLLAAVAVAAAQQSSKVPAQSSGQPTDRVTKEVRHELISLPYYSVFDNLAYRVDGGKVTLFGQVAQPVLKSDAGNVVKKIEGVTSVDNEIEVLPTSISDDQLRRVLFHAIYGKPGLSRYAEGAVPPIHIIVKNGNVTLEGMVATDMDKTLAGMAAREVNGTFFVTNNLRLDNK